MLSDKKMRTVLTFICFILSVHCYPQAKKYTPKVMHAIETYAFLKGQSSALKAIAIQFPTLKNDVIAIEKTSDIVFGRAERNIEHFLQEDLGAAEFKVVIKYVDSLLNKQLKNPIQKKEYADEFLKTIRNRLLLNTDTALTKGIISYAYHDAPHEEIIDGYTKIFTTKSHLKSPESALKLPIPKSWRAEEAEMTATIQQFTSNDGNGNEKILIVIYDLPVEQDDFVLSEITIPEMISPETKIIRTETIKIDGKPGLMIEAEEILNSATGNLKVRMLQFMFSHKQKLYCLQGSVGPAELNKNLEHKLKKCEPLFRLIAFNTEIE